MRTERWICMNCGQVIAYPSVDPKTRLVVCTFCRKPALEEIPREQIRAQAVMA
jgi:DNA-directed RNA polymerase subunit RPC12/RpoP